MKKFEDGIVNGLLRILFLLRVGSVIGLFAVAWFTPMPWKAIVLSPFVGGPIMALGVQVLRRVQGAAGGRPFPAEDAERRRVRAGMDQHRRAYLGSVAAASSGHASVQSEGGSPVAEILL